MVKRMSNKWFARAAFSLMDWHENIGPGSIQNPTRTDVTGGQAGQPAGTAGAGLSGPQVDGGQIAPRSSGSGKGDLFYNARWQLVVNALYELPANFQVGTSIFGRQGYVYPVILRLDAGNDGTLRTLATSTLDEQRYENLWNVDFRLANRIKLTGRASVEVTADLFNAFNNGSILGRNRAADSDAFRSPTEVLSPRILRVGLRFNF
jgi:hypothetical protein